MKCPKCSKKLKIITLKGGKWYGHSYSFAHAMSSKPMCDYSKKIETKRKDSIDKGLSAGSKGNDKLW